MALFRRPVQPATITAAATQITSPTDYRFPTTDDEQLYNLVQNLGQVRAALKFKSMAASKVEYYIATQLGPGEAPERVDGDTRVDEAYDRLRGLTGGVPEFVGEFAEHLDISGQGMLVGWGDGDDNNILGKDQWDVVSPVEFNKAKQSGYTGGGAKVPPITDSEFTLRIWRPDPAYRERAESPLRSVEPECEQYILLRAMLTSIATSRLMAGILEIPSGWTFPPKANGDPAPPFFDILFDAISSAATNADSGSRLVPTVVMRPDGADQASFLDLARELPEWVPTLMERVLRQIATGLDLPADILLGLADVNHWTAWLSEDSAKLDYVDPLILLILDSLTHGYLHPALAQAGVTNPQDYMFWRDYSDLIARSVGSSDAMGLYDRGIISEEATRRVVGFTDSDAPDADSPDSLPPDFAQKITSTGELIRAGFDPQAILEALGLPPIEHTGLAPITLQRPEDIDPVAEPDTPPAPAGRDNVVRGVPGTLTAAGQTFGLGAIDHRLYTQLSEVCQAGLDRALERAGQKIRSHAVGDPRRTPKHPTLAAAINKVPNRDVGLTLGASVKETLQLTDDELIPETAFDSITARIRAILARGQTETYDAIQSQTETKLERDLPQEDSWLERAVGFILAGLGAYALKRLFTPQLTEDPASSGEIEPTQIPSPLIFDTLTIAGGGEPGFNPEAPRGLANGEQAQTWLVQAGFSVQEREWTIGAPAMPFEPHRNLRGTRFTEWTDPALATPLTADWLGVSFMFPGDHRGCQCVAELVVEPALVSV